MPAYSVNGGTISYSNNVFINNGNSVTLSPQVSAEFSGGRWEWSNGATTQEIIINDIQSGGIYSVNYFLDDKTFTLDYNICIAISNKTITDGEYFIRNPLNDTYLTNDGTYQPVFKEKDDSNIASQTWNIFKDILRYKFVSVLDEKYLNWEGMFTDNTYSRTKSSYILHGLENSNLHAIQNSSSQGNGYWGITADNIIDGNASTTIDGYPFEFVSTTLSSIDKVTADFISVYPNPVEDMLNINISEDILSANDKAQLIIFSQSGILINIFEVKAGHNSFDSQNIESGVYFGVIKSNDINHRFKIVKK